jgi:signal peptidase
MQPKEQTESKKLQSINYIGPSMNPTLRPGDRLHIIPCDSRKVQRGDVVVFIPPGGDSKVIHRVVAMDSQGIRTRGDNCTDVDPWILSPEQVLGRVVCARRRNKRLRVFGGPVGRLLAVAIRGIHSIDSSVSELLRASYNRLARVGTFRRFLPASMEPRVISLSRPAGTELQLIIGRRVIGRWLPGMTRWHIRRPFRLFVDEDSLPRNPAGQRS